MIKDNSFMGWFELIGILLVLCGVFKIEVFFDIDVNGIFNVFVKDQSIGRINVIIIINDMGRLLEVEIDWMVNEVEKYKEED